MITDADIKKLKKVFATKDDLKRLATKDDLNRFATKEDFGFLSKKISDLGEKMDKIYLNLAEEIGNVLKETQEIKDELKDHSKKIKKLESAKLN